MIGDRKAVPEIWIFTVASRKVCRLCSIHHNRSCFIELLNDELVPGLPRENLAAAAP